MYSTMSDLAVAPHIEERREEIARLREKFIPPTSANKIRSVISEDYGDEFSDDFWKGYLQLRRFNLKRMGVNGIPRWWVHILLLGRGLSRREAGMITLKALG